MSRLNNFLLQDETYEDGLKRALRCWAVQSKRLEQVEAELENCEQQWGEKWISERKENERLRKALEGKDDA